MQLEPVITLLWTAGATLGGVLGVLLCAFTLTPKKKRAITFAWWALIIAAYFAVMYLVYSYNISLDMVGILLLVVFLCGGTVLLYKNSAPECLFIAIMSALIQTVSTFFFCGTVLSFIDNTPNPYNVKTLATFLTIKLFIYFFIILIYHFVIERPIREAIETIGSRMRNNLPIPIVSIVAFSVFSELTNRLGILPGIPDTRYYFIGFYLIICTIFVFEFWQIFSSAIWSSRALKTEAELGVASQIQASILPYTFPAFPERKEFDIFATMDTAKEVGGDFYDFFLVGENKLAVVMADVSGKGVPAALFMMIARTLIKNETLSGHEPSEIFEKVNDQLCENNDAEMFVTAFLGILDMEKKVMTVVNAGHNPPLLRHCGQNFEWLKIKPGFVLAGMNGVPYKQYEIPFEPGDDLFLYTDGVTEAVNPRLELYSEERLFKELNSISKDTPIADTIHTIRGSIDTFAQGASQADDITMLMLRYFV